jgi:hypothetical protein
MNQCWTLQIENFARIESADIEISPLMYFISSNNSDDTEIIGLSKSVRESRREPVILLTSQQNFNKIFEVSKLELEYVIQADHN